MKTLASLLCLLSFIALFDGNNQHSIDLAKLMGCEKMAEWRNPGKPSEWIVWMHCPDDTMGKLDCLGFYRMPAKS